MGSDTLADEGSEGVKGVSSFGRLVGLERRSMSMIESSSFFMVSIRVTRDLAHLMAVRRRFRSVGVMFWSRVRSMWLGRGSRM